MLLSFLLEKTSGMDKKTFLKTYPRPALYFAANAPDSPIQIVPQKRWGLDTLHDDTDIQNVEILSKKENLLKQNPIDIFTETGRQGIQSFRNKDAIFFLIKDLTRGSLSSDFGNSASITLGRAGYNDIILADGMISKNHAIFIHLPSRDRWMIIDQVTTNGTVVDEMPLKARLPHLLRDKSQIVFARKFGATFMQPSMVWEFFNYQRHLGEEV